MKEHSGGSTWQAGVDIQIYWLSVPALRAQRKGPSGNGSQQTEANLLLSLPMLGMQRKGPSVDGTQQAKADLF